MQNFVITIQIDFIVHVKADDIYKKLQKMIKQNCDTSNFEIDRPLPARKKSKWTNKR